MAKRTVVEIFDDIDGTPLEEEGETISFALDGVEYTIDLNKKNARDFRKKIEPYVAHATRVGGRKRRGSPAGVSGVIPVGTQSNRSAVGSGETEGRRSATARAVWAARCSGECHTASSGRPESRSAMSAA